MSIVTQTTGHCQQTQTAKCRTYYYDHYQGLAVSALVSQLGGCGFKSPPMQNFFQIYALPTNSAVMSTLTSNCRWHDETARERTGHLPSSAKAKKLKSLTSVHWLPLD